MARCSSQWDVQPPGPAIVRAGETPSPVAARDQDKWKRFQELKQRRQMECGKSTAKRVQHMQTQATNAVLSEFYGEEVVQALNSTGHRRRHRKRKHKQGSHDSTDESHDPPAESEWEKLKQFLDPNPQLKESLYDTQPKSGLEERLEVAISDGQLTKASELSDAVADRELVTNVARAFDCKKFLEKKKEEEKQRKSKKQKLHWRFEAKERWETKSNM